MSSLCFILLLYVYSDISWTIRSHAWVGRKQYYKGRHKFPQSNISWRKACCDLAFPCIARISTIVIICISHREINPESRYQGNLWCNTWGSSRWIFASSFINRTLSNIARDFQETWNLPHVVCAIDGKHIRIHCPKQSGILFHNYKGFFSFVLLTICVARYCFPLFDVGQYGSNNNAGVLANSNIGKKIGAGKMSIPPPRHLEGSSLDPFPYYLVRDEIFPLETWLMRPYPGQLSEEERILHYRLSHAKRVIENTFRILAARWSNTFSYHRHNLKCRKLCSGHYCPP